MPSHRQPTTTAMRDTCCADSYSYSDSSFLCHHCRSCSSCRSVAVGFDRERRTNHEWWLVWATALVLCVVCIWYAVAQIQTSQEAYRFPANKLVRHTHASIPTPGVVMCTRNPRAMLRLVNRSTFGVPCPGCCHFTPPEGPNTPVRALEPCAAGQTGVQKFMLRELSSEPVPCLYVLPRVGWLYSEHQSFHFVVNLELGGPDNDFPPVFVGALLSPGANYGHGPHNLSALALHEVGVQNVLVQGCAVVWTFALAETQTVAGDVTTRYQTANSRGFSWAGNCNQTRRLPQQLQLDILPHSFESDATVEFVDYDWRAAIGAIAGVAGALASFFSVCVGAPDQQPGLLRRMCRCMIPAQPLPSATDEASPLLVAGTQRGHEYHTGGDTPLTSSSTLSNSVVNPQPLAGTS